MVYILLFLLIILSFLLKNPKFIGYLGERKVRKRLFKLDPSIYFTLHDVMIPAASGGKTSQIDHLIVSPYGVFVIETKNYQGWIFGKENQAYWTQTIYKRKERFLNPIWQNKGHVKALQELLSEYPQIPYHSIVVFDNRAKLKIDVTSKVVYTSELLFTIQMISETRVSSDQVKDIYHMILSNNQTNRKARKAHVKQINQDLQQETLKVAEMICPRCEGELVERKGKDGTFLGCANYPKCRYVVKERKVVSGGFASTGKK